jgi:sugar O-acyltransferase (sialic acid O-acetyltransferase NeuD family)
MAKKIGIIGFGGLAREIACSIDRNLKYNHFVLNHEYEKYKDNELIKPMSDFDPNLFQAIVGIGDPKIRQKIIENELPDNTEYYTFIDKSAIILDKNTIKIGKGSVIMAGSILTTNIKIGDHAMINPTTTIGHDTIIGDFFTSCPGTNIAGCCNIGNRNMFGIASSVKNNITICNDVMLGLGAGVVKNITDAGTYIGLPAKKMKVKL